MDNGRSHVVADVVDGVNIEDVIVADNGVDWVAVIARYGIGLLLVLSLSELLLM